MSIPVFTVLLQSLLLTILVVSYVTMRKRRFVPTILALGRAHDDLIAFYRLLVNISTDQNQLFTTPLISIGHVRLLNCSAKVACIPLRHTDSVLIDSLPNIHLPHVMLVIYMADPKDLDKAAEDILKLLKIGSIGCEIVVSTRSNELEVLQAALALKLADHTLSEVSRVVYAIGNPEDNWRELLAATWRHA